MRRLWSVQRKKTGFVAALELEKWQDRREKWEENGEFPGFPYYCSHIPERVPPQPQSWSHRSYCAALSCSDVSDFLKPQPARLLCPWEPPIGTNKNFHKSLSHWPKDWGNCGVEEEKSFWQEQKSFWQHLANSNQMTMGKILPFLCFS